MVFYANKVTASTQNDTRWARITRGVAASTKLVAGTKGHTANHRRAQNSHRGRKHHFSHSAPLLGVFMGYSRSIRGIYVCIGYVSGMYRVCIGYLSEKYRKIGERLEVRGERLEGRGETIDSWQCHRERCLNNRNNIIQQHLRSHNATSAEEGRTIDS